MPVLTKKMEKYVLKKTKVGYTNEHSSKYNRRIIEYAKKGIEQLTLLAENLPEEQLEEIFNRDNLRRFFANVLFKVEPNMIDEKKRKKRRRRILELWHTIVFAMRTPGFAAHLAPEAYEAIKTREQHDEIAAFIAIRSAILHEDL